jgi:hypothetical protein
MRIGICGPRSFTSKYVINNVIDYVINEDFGGYEDVSFVSGGAQGVDKLAKEYINKNYPCSDFKEILPDYDKFAKHLKKLAPLERNTQIVKACSGLIAFWDERSSGTKDTICKAICNGITVWLYNINNGFLNKSSCQYVWNLNNVK